MRLITLAHLSKLPPLPLSAVFLSPFSAAAVEQLSQACDMVCSTLQATAGKKMQ